MFVPNADLISNGDARADTWDVVCNDHFEPVALNVTVVPVKS